MVDDVWTEIGHHAPQALTFSQLHRVSGIRSAPERFLDWRLDAGELMALSYALTLGSSSEDLLILCDEREARRACSALGIAVTGSIGLIVQACRSGRVERDVAELALRGLPGRGRLHVSPDLLDAAIAAL